MKKKVIFVSAVAIAAFTVWSIRSSQCEKSGIDSLMLASVEALSGTEGTGNTGPREEVKCIGGNYHIICMSLNNIDCTEDPCNCLYRN